MDARAAAGLTWDDVASEAGVAKSSLVTSITSGRTSMRRLGRHAIGDGATVPGTRTGIDADGNLT